VATEWLDFTEVDFAEVRRRMHTAIVFDGRNLLDADAIGDLGFQYYSVGRPQPKPSDNGYSELISPIKFEPSSKNAGKKPREEVTRRNR
jgi:hypothetical protein